MAGIKHKRVVLSIEMAGIKRKRVILLIMLYYRARRIIEHVVLSIEENLEVVQMLKT